MNCDLLLDLVVDETHKANVYVFEIKIWTCITSQAWKLNTLQNKHGDIEHLSTGVEHQKEIDRIDWRRSKIQELSSRGHSQREIAQILQISNGTVNRDLSILRQQAKTNIKRYIREVFGWTYCNHKRSMEYSSKYRR